MIERLIDSIAYFIAFNFTILILSIPIYIGICIYVLIIDKHHAEITRKFKSKDK